MNGALGDEREIEHGHQEPEQAAGIPHQQDAPQREAQQVLTAYEEALGGQATRGAQQRILTDAAELLALGRPLAWLIDRARELPQYGSNLMKHVEVSKVPFARPAAAARAVPDTQCVRHPHMPKDCPQCRRASMAASSGPRQIDPADLFAAN